MNNLKNKRRKSYHDLKKTSLLGGSDFDILFTHVSQKKREYFYSHPEMKLSEKKILVLINLEKKRLNNWPLSYLINEQGFFNISLKVSSSVLIPRPETEVLVDFVIKKVSLKNKKEKINIIDIGCGSGAIIISLAKNLNKEKNLSFQASDISLSALKIAKENAKSYRLDKKIIFKKGDLVKPWENLLRSSFDNNEKILITANLPYLNPREMKESSLAKEPRLALLSGLDGLNHYRKLFAQLSTFTKKYRGFKTESIFLICEINPHQVDAFNKMVKATFPKAKLELKKDLRRKNRFVLIQL